MNKIFSLTGEIIYGKQVGRELGFPTANLNIKGASDCKHGVYGVMVHIDSKKYYGILNYGVRPHFNDGNKVTCEVYILDFSDTIYGKTIQVEANTYLREQQSFQNNQALIDQYNRDVLDIRDFYNLPKI